MADNELRLERDELRRERDELRLERDNLRLERDTFRRERDVLRGERDEIQREQAALRRETSQFRNVLLESLRGDAEHLRQFAEQNARHHEERARWTTETEAQNRRHNEERMQWRQGVNEQIDLLLNAHIESSTAIQNQLRHMNDRVTIHPNDPLTMGFALAMQKRESDEKPMLRFIAAQRQTVMKELSSQDTTEILIGFTSVASGVNLRRRLVPAANQRLVERLGVEEAQASGIKFKCCRSDWEEVEGFSIEDVTDLIDELIIECTNQVHPIDTFQERYEEAQAFIQQLVRQGA